MWIFIVLFTLLLFGSTNKVHQCHHSRTVLWALWESPHPLQDRVRLPQWKILSNRSNAWKALSERCWRAEYTYLTLVSISRDEQPPLLSRHLYASRGVDSSTLGPKAQFQFRLSHPAGFPTLSPVFAGPDLLSGSNLDLATSLWICPATPGLPVTTVIVTNLALLRHCGTVPWLVRALSCPCCGHPRFILPQGTALALLPDSTMHTMLCFLLLVILLGLMDKY